MSKRKLLFGRDEIKEAVAHNIANPLKTSKDFSQLKSLLLAETENIGGAYGSPESRVTSIEKSLQYLNNLVPNKENNAKSYNLLQEVALECSELPISARNGWYERNEVHNNNIYIYEFSILLGLILEEPNSFFDL